MNEVDQYHIYAIYTTGWRISEIWLAKTSRISAKLSKNNNGDNDINNAGKNWHNLHMDRSTFFSFWAYCSAFGITNGKEFHKISTAVENDQSLLVFDLSSEY